MICFDDNSRDHEKVNLETRAGLERYADPNEALEQKIKENNQIRMVIPFCQEKKQRIRKNLAIYLKMIKRMKIVGQLSKKLAKMALAFTCRPPYSALKLR
jgi:hypothetical protein